MTKLSSISRFVKRLRSFGSTLPIIIFLTMKFIQNNSVKMNRDNRNKIAVVTLATLVGGLVVSELYRFITQKTRREAMIEQNILEADIAQNNVVVSQWIENDPDLSEFVRCRKEYDRSCDETLEELKISDEFMKLNNAYNRTRNTFINIENMMRGNVFRILGFDCLRIKLVSDLFVLNLIPYSVMKKAYLDTQWLDKVNCNATYTKRRIDGEIVKESWENDENGETDRPRFWMVIEYLYNFKPDTLTVYTSDLLRIKMREEC